MSPDLVSRQIWLDTRSAETAPESRKAHLTWANGLRPSVPLVRRAKIYWYSETPGQTLFALLYFCT